MYGIKAIVGKELRRVFKDKKMVMSLFVLPILMVVGIFALMSVLIKGRTDDIEAHEPVVYIANAPESFDSFAVAAGIEGYMEPELTGNSADWLETAKTGLLDATVDLIVCFPDNFESAVMTGANELASVTIPQIEVYYNPSEDYSSQARSVYQTYFEMYKQGLLANRFGDYSAVMMFDVTDNQIQDEDKATGKMLGMMLPYFITMLITT